MLLCWTTNDEQVKIELLSQWMLEAEFRNKNCHVLVQLYVPLYIFESLMEKVLHKSHWLTMQRLQVQALSLNISESCGGNCICLKLLSASKHLKIILKYSHFRYYAPTPFLQ